MPNLTAKVEYYKILRAAGSCRVNSGLWLQMLVKALTFSYKLLSPNGGTDSLKYNKRPPQSLLSPLYCGSEVPILTLGPLPHSPPSLFLFWVILTSLLLSTYVIILFSSLPLLFSCVPFSLLRSSCLSSIPSSPQGQLVCVELTTRQLLHCLLSLSSCPLRNNAQPCLANHQPQWQQYRTPT